jgi:ABC-type phosphate transport system permease subunit
LSGILAGILLGLGRVIGETMVVLLVAGVLLVVGGIVQVAHPTHRSTPHAGVNA